MRTVKSDCDDEASSMNNDQITTTVRPSSLLLDHGISSPEMKDARSSQHSSLRHAIQMPETHEDVPSDPFVFSSHQSRENEVRSKFVFSDLSYTVFFFLIFDLLSAFEHCSLRNKRILFLL